MQTCKAFTGKTPGKTWCDNKNDVLIRLPNVSVGLSDVVYKYIISVYTTYMYINCIIFDNVK